MARRKKGIPTVDKSTPTPAERIPHHELVRECREDGKGWRVDAFGNWWPCEQDAHAAEQDRAAD